MALGNLMTWLGFGMIAVAVVILIYYVRKAD